MKSPQLQKRTLCDKHKLCPSFFGNTPCNNLKYVETSQSICFANRLTGFHTMQASTERYLETNFNGTCQGIKKHYELNQIHIQNFVYIIRNKTLNLQYDGIFCTIWRHVKVFKKYFLSLFSTSLLFRTCFPSILIFFWKWFIVFLNLIFCTNAIKSFSNCMKSFTCFSVFKDLSPYHSLFMPFVSFLTLHNTFHLILLITISILSIIYNKYVLFCGIPMFFIEHPKLISSIV